MKKYTKVSDDIVLKAYKNIQSKNNKIGNWVDYISINSMALNLKTSKYQVRKAYKSLKGKGLMKLEKIPTYCEDYDNGLSTVGVPILYAEVYVLTDEGNTYLELLESEDRQNEDIN